MANDYDVGGRRNPNDEEPVAAQPQPQRPQQPQGGSPYDGMIAENAQGHRVVYRSNASGRGRWVEISPATADADSRQIWENEQSVLSQLRATSRLAEAFIDHNRQSGTGGFGQSEIDLPFFNVGVPAWRAPHRQAMQGLSADMVRSNIRPGMAQTMNSDAEAMMAARTYPSEESGGDINAERAVRILVNRDVQIELVNQIEQWLRQHPSIAGFQQHWRQVEPQLRENITREHVRRFGTSNYGFPRLNDRGIYDPNAPSIADRRAADERRGAPSPQGAIRFERDPDTGEIRRVQ